MLSAKADKLTPEKRDRILGQIADRADHLARLVDDLLLASRVAEPGQGAKLEVTMAEWPAAALVDEAVASFPSLGERLTLDEQCNGSIVLGDRVRVVQCLTNLIGNAQKYSPEGTPIRVEARCEPIDDDPAGGVVIAVTDQGRGIPAPELDRIFDRFYRVEDPMTMTTGGSGLGLFIARELAIAMGGDIDVTSTLGEGSTFRLHLRAAKGSETRTDRETVRVEGEV